MNVSIRAFSLGGLRSRLSILTGLGLAITAHSAVPWAEVDRRTHLTPGAQAQDQPAVALAERLPGVQVHRHPLTGSPSWVARPEGFLTGPGGGGSISSKTLAAQPPGDPYAIVKAFVNEHTALFGHDATELEHARITRDYITSHNDLHTTVWEQQHAGITVFEGVFLAHVTRRGELVNLSSQFISNPAAAVARGHGSSQGVVPAISAQQALAVACTNLGALVSPAEVALPMAAADGADRLQKWHGGLLRGEGRTRLVWLPTDSQTLRLAWEVFFMPRSVGRMFRTVVDAQTGEVWVRHDFTREISNISLRVFTNDSPTPLLPGYNAPGTSGQPAARSRSLVTLSAYDTTASPLGWINDGVNETRGNNVDAHTDVDDDNQPDLPRPQGSPSRVFDFPLDLTQDPSTYRKAAIVNLFYWNNWMHDRLYQLGFTEAAGNFQGTNFNKGGLGSDAVLADAQDGGSFNNANFSYTPDGTAPRMQMYVYDGPTPHRDGDFDATIILHEYTHGLSERLVGGGVGITAKQTGGMGEGWSDFYSLSLLAPAAAPLGANYQQGAYASRGFNSFGAFTIDGDNYYFGVRRYPYSTNLLVNPLTFRDIDPSQIDAHAGVPKSPLFPGIAASEAHNVGEVWCITLWEARARLIAKLGYATGNARILQLVTDGMKLSPGNPTFTQARDAILQADQVDYAGADQSDLWAAFAKRGLGFDAVAPPSTTTYGVIESFNLPDSLRVLPPSDITITGPQGGPFSLASTNYILSNAGPASLTWTANAVAPFSVLPVSGSLAAGAKQTVIVSFNAAQAVNLTGAPQYFVRFSNQVSHLLTQRRFTIQTYEPLRLTSSQLWHSDEWLRGAQGGPFTDIWGPMVLTNLSAQSMSWTAVMPDTLALTPSSGTLAPGQGIQLVLSGSPAANLLPVGSYTNSFSVSNLLTGATGMAKVRMDVLNDHYITEVFGNDSPLDLTNKTLTFFPNANNPAGYDTCLTPATQFPSDTSGGGSLPHSGSTFQSSAEVVLSGSALVSLFGQKTNHVWVNFDGTLTLDGPDQPYPYNYVNAHFSHRQVSGLYDQANDFYTAQAGGTITWKQLPDRFAVTWQKLVVPNTVGPTATNNFQVELFYDGTVRLTILSALQGLTTVTGLSSGPGTTPSDYMDSDFSASPDCSALLPALTITAPTPLKEGQVGRLPTGLVSIPAPRGADLVVSLSSSDTTELTVSSSVTIPAGATSATFGVTPLNDQKLDGSHSVTLTATANGYNPGHTYVVVTDAQSTTLNVQVPATLTEGAGYVQGKVWTPVPVGDNTTVFLGSAPAGQLQFGGFIPVVVIPGGQTSAVFQVQAVDNHAIDGTRSATITASVANWTNGTASVQILDDETTNLQVVGPLFLGEGLGMLTNAGQVRISGTLTTNLTVTLNSDNFFAVWPFGPVTIPAGQTNAWFNLFDWDDQTIEPLRLIGLTASAPGFADGSWGVFLFDNDGPPKAINPSPYNYAEEVSLDADLSWGPQEGQLLVNGGFESLTAGWTLENTGAGSWVAAASGYQPPGEDGPLAPHTGAYSAFTEQPGNGRHTLWQEVALPSGDAPIQLSWSQRIHNHATAFASNQQFRVELRDATNGVLQTLFATQPGDPLLSGWTNLLVDLSGYGGQTIRVAFVEEDALGALNVAIDDVSLYATPPAPTSWQVYFGTAPAPGAAQYQGTTTNTSWALGPMAVNTTYYWQVNSVRAGATNAGPVWQFITTTSANRPPTVALNSPNDFSVLRPPTNVALTLASLQDDGVVTNVEFYADSQKLGQAAVAPQTYTWTNPIIGEHGLYAVAVDNAGLRGTSTVHHVTILPPVGTTLTTLVPWEATWRYLDDGSDLGTTWRSSSYTGDRYWATGPARFGFGKGDEATLLDFGGDPYNKVLTYYFRTSFTSPNAVIQSVLLNVLRDDGIAVYLNGTSVLRDNLATKAVYSTPAVTDISGANETIPLITTVSPTNLVSRGRSNTLAAEVHLASASSVDLLFDLELAAVMNLQPTATLLAPFSGSVFLTPTNLMLTAQASEAYGVLTNVEFFADNQSLGKLAAPPYTLVWTNASPGDHLLTVAATDQQGATTLSTTTFVRLLAPTPILRASADASSFYLSWPTNAVNYHLETATNLGPAAFWLPLTNAPIIINGQVWLSLPPPTEAARFFRLAAP